MTPRSFTINGDFENLALPVHQGVEGLLFWDKKAQPTIEDCIKKFKDVVPEQQPLFISKESWEKLWTGNGFVSENEEVYLFLFCAAYDEYTQSVYYRIRLITILKSDLVYAQTAVPQPTKVNVRVYASPIAYTVPNMGGEDCIKWVSADDSDENAKLEKINLDVANWKEKVRKSLKDLLVNYEPKYIGDMVGAKRIKDILGDIYPHVKGITLSPALYRNADDNKPFMAFLINDAAATVGQNIADILKCPPGGNPCANLKSMQKD